jgi:tRNA(Ile2)-agmatinylcytidine synthase
MTSAGRGKGYKCRTCVERSHNPEVEQIERHIRPGWYEVPPSARRHLARPLARGVPLWEENLFQSIRKGGIPSVQVNQMIFTKKDL